MEHIGVTGTRWGLSEVQREWLEGEVGAYAGREVMLHHGDCLGVDAQAHALFYAAGFDVTIHPPTASVLRAFCTDAYLVHPRKEYATRNRDIVIAADVLYAFPEGPEDRFPRSGTWQTVRMARRLCVPLHVVLPDGTVLDR